MKASCAGLLALGALLTWAPIAQAQSLVAAVLPSSRAVVVGGTATAFAAVVNQGPGRASGCRLAPLTPVPATFSFQTTNPFTNTLTGTPDAPVDIPAGATQTFLMAFTPSAPIAPADVQIEFSCANAAPAATMAGLNTLLLSATAPPGPDVVALAATTSGDGIAAVPGTYGTTSFAVATVNVGAAGTVTAAADTGGAALPVTLTVCQTDPATGACLAPAAATAALTIAAGATPTVAVFVTYTGPVAFDPAASRIFVRFRDGGGATRGSTSVAARADSPAAAYVGAAALSAADVMAVTQGAATAVDAPLVVAVVDRMGNPLAVFRKTGAPALAIGNFGVPVSTGELALSLARTGAFFSNDRAPLSSRTVRFISGIHFPPGIANKANAALYGIENTNRGCTLNALFNPGKTITPARALNGLPCNAFDRRGCGLGITTGKADTGDSNPGAVNGGGVPIFKNGALVGGVGVAGASPQAAEFAALVGSFAGPGFGPVVPDPGVIFLDGIALPFVAQTTQPAGTVPGTFAGAFTLGPIASPLGAAGVPDGWLIGPFSGSLLTAADVNRIVAQAVEQANRTRAAIRLPLGSTTRMMIAVADLDGTLLGVFRMPDATIFSIDVATAKARNVVYFSSLARAPMDLPLPAPFPFVPLGTAVTNRTISFGAQPLFPPGIDVINGGSLPGPFFNLYLDDVATPCAQGTEPAHVNQSGIVFFPGSTPLHRNGVMVGGLGVSGDGVEQDDLVSAAGATGFAPDPAIRADQIVVDAPGGEVRLPYLKFSRNLEAL
ncbi:MAG: heme-binding protein [Candidatus Rokuibacteriota bacterium]